LFDLVKHVVVGLDHTIAGSLGIGAALIPAVLVVEGVVGAVAAPLAPLIGGNALNHVLFADNGFASVTNGVAGLLNPPAPEPTPDAVQKQAIAPDTFAPPSTAVVLGPLLDTLVGPGFVQGIIEPLNAQEVYVTNIVANVGFNLLGENLNTVVAGDGSGSAVFAPVTDLLSQLDNGTLAKLGLAGPLSPVVEIVDGVLTIAGNVLSPILGGLEGSPLDALTKALEGSPLDALTKGLEGNPLDALTKALEGSPLDALTKGLEGSPLDALTKALEGSPLDALTKGLEGSPLDALTKALEGSPLDALTKGLEGSPLDALTKALEGSPLDALTKGLEGSPLDALTKALEGSPLDALTKGMEGNPLDALTKALEGSPANGLLATLGVGSGDPTPGTDVAHAPNLAESRSALLTDHASPVDGLITLLGGGTENPLTGLTDALNAGPLATVTGPLTGSISESGQSNPLTGILSGPLLSSDESRGTDPSHTVTGILSTGTDLLEHAVPSVSADSINSHFAVLTESLGTLGSDPMGSLTHILGDATSTAQHQPTLTTTEPAQSATAVAAIVTSGSATPVSDLLHVPMIASVTSIVEPHTASVTSGLNGLHA
jgi:hypothetical protein